MTEHDVHLELLREWRRVVGADVGRSTDFFVLPTPSGAVAPVVAWLRTLPAGLGEAEFEHRRRARRGDGPSA